MTDYRGLMLLADSAEDIECLGTLDLLRRAKIKVDLVSIMDRIDVTMQSGLKVIADDVYENISLKDYDFLVIPGGGAILKTHLESKKTKEAIDEFCNNGLLVAAICAAPSTLGINGYLDNLEYTCYPSFEKFSEKGIYQGDKKVVVSKNIITSKACGTTFEFAYEIIKYLKGENVANHILETVFYNK